jgi:hypothetical protein
MYKQNLAQSLQGNMAAINLLGEKLEDMIRSNIIISKYDRVYKCRNKQ